MADFADTVAEAYRKDLWQRQPEYAEFWIEKDAIASVVQDVTEKYDVHIRPLRGNSSLTFLYQAARDLERIQEANNNLLPWRPRSERLDIERSAKKGLLEILDEEFGGTYYKLEWRRLAILPEDFEDFNLVPLLPKNTDTRYAKFIAEHGNRAAELDALPPDELRRRVEDAVLGHINPMEWHRLQLQEKRERERFQSSLKGMLAKLGQAGSRATGDGAGNT